MNIWIKAKNFISSRRREATSLDENILTSKRQLLEIFDGITDPILIVDCSFRILRLNKAMLLILDEAKTYNEFIGRYCYNVLHKKKDVCDYCPVANLFIGGEISQKKQTVDFVRGGKGKKFDVFVFPLRDNKGRVYAAVKYFKDVTYLVQLETELYDAERSRILGTVALGLAHELRNPLAVISSVAQYLQKEHPDNEIGNSMETIIRNADVANNVIADLLNFARPKERKIEVVDLDCVLENGLRLIKDKLASQKIKVHRKFDKTIQKTWLDCSSFTQAFINFLLNAVDSMPAGGELYIETKREDDHVRIMISDTGKGYPPEIIDRIFKPFSRSKGGPVDLRLPIAEDIIKSHGGSVELYNNEDSGATAAIRIPIVAGGMVETKV